MMRRVTVLVVVGCLILSQSAVWAVPALAAAASADSTGARPKLRLGADPPDRRLQFLAGGAGLVGGLALAVVLKSKADDRYAGYLATADPDRARSLFDSAERYDRLSLIGWGVAQVALVYLFYLFTREDKRPLIPTQGEPVVEVERDGVQLGWRVAP